MVVHRVVDVVHDAGQLEIVDLRPQVVEVQPRIGTQIATQRDEHVLLIVARWNAGAVAATGAVVATGTNALADIDAVVQAAAPRIGARVKGTAVRSVARSQ